MRTARPRSAAQSFIATASSLLAAELTLLALACKPAPVPAPPPASKPATTAPATSQAAATTRPGPPRTYMQLVKLTYPDSPATQPLESPLDRKDAARILLREPVLLDRSANLWITRPDAEPADVVLKRAETDAEHLVRERPAYVHWHYVEPTKREPGRWAAVMVCPTADGRSIEFVEASRRTTIDGKARAYHWPDAFSWNGNVVVGSATGASVFRRTDGGWEELPSPDLIDAATPHAPTQVPVDAAGLIAYVPAERGTPGSEKVAHFVNGQWSLLTNKEKWPGPLVHLIPLADGSVLQLLAEPDTRVRLAFTDFNDAKVDSQQVLPLIAKLDDQDQETRQAAYRQLSTYGTALWPLLEKELDNQPAGVQDKLRQLLKNKTDPTLGEMSLVDSRLRLAARTPDGGALFYAKGGVSVLNVDGDQDLVAPAWVSARAGSPIRLMIGTVWADMTPNDKRFYPIGGSDWIVSDDAQGPRELIGTFDLQPILRRSEVKYSEFLGVDRKGRWLFREPLKPAATTAPAADDRETLIIDPYLPPVKPRLPVWEFMAKDGATGCDESGWPAYRDKAENTWIINAEGFQLVNKKEKHEFVNEAAALGKLPRTGPTTLPAMPAPAAATKPAAAPTTGPAAQPLLTTADGTRFYGGLTSLLRVTSNGQSFEYPLPDAIQGSVTPWLVESRDGRLFLFNEPGRFARLRLTDDPAAPLRVEATFTYKIPNVEPRRVWLDPADRIVFAYDDDKLAITFPTGVVPPAIAEKMPPTPPEDDDE